MPAYNAEKTLRRTFDEIPHDIVDAVLLVDDLVVPPTEQFTIRSTEEQKP